MQQNIQNMNLYQENLLYPRGKYVKIADPETNSRVCNKYSLFIQIIEYGMSYFLMTLVHNSLEAFIRRDEIIIRASQQLLKLASYAIQFLENFLQGNLCSWRITQSELGLIVKWREESSFAIPLGIYYLPSLDFWGFNFEECKNIEWPSEEEINILGIQFTEFRSLLNSINTNDIFEQTWAIERLATAWCWGSFRNAHQKMSKLNGIRGEWGNYQLIIEEDPFVFEENSFFNRMKRKISNLLTAVVRIFIPPFLNQEEETETENLSEVPIEEEESFFIAPELLQEERRGPFAVYQDLSRVERERRRIRNPPFLVRKD